MLPGVAQTPAKEPRRRSPAHSLTPTQRSFDDNNAHPVMDLEGSHRALEGEDNAQKALLSSWLPVSPAPDYYGGDGSVPSAVRDMKGASTSTSGPALHSLEDSPAGLFNSPYLVSVQCLWLCILSGRRLATCLQHACTDAFPLVGGACYLENNKLGLCM